MEFVKVTDLDGTVIALNVNVIEVILVGYNDKKERCNGIKLSTEKYSFGIKETAYELLEQDVVRENFVQCLDDNGEIMLINKACIVSFSSIVCQYNTLTVVRLAVKEKAFSSYIVQEVSGYSVA